MNTSTIGKFQVLQTLNDFDSALIELYGVNMTDAHLTRYEALVAIESTQGPAPRRLADRRTQGLAASGAGRLSSG